MSPSNRKQRCAGGNTFVGVKEPLGIEQAAKNKTIRPQAEKDTAREKGAKRLLSLLSLVPELPKKWRRNVLDRTADR
jgi:hypothetical protein